MSGWWLAGPGSWGSHASDHAAPGRSRATSPVTTLVRDVIAAAVETHGQKRGVHRAAELLGIAERTARDIQGGRTTGASVAEITALEARAAIRRDRRDQLRAERARIEGELNAMDAQDGCASCGVVR